MGSRNHWHAAESTGYGWLRSVCADCHGNGPGISCRPFANMPNGVMRSLFRRKTIMGHDRTGHPIHRSILFGHDARWPARRRRDLGCPRLSGPCVLAKVLAGARPPRRPLRTVAPTRRRSTCARHTPCHPAGLLTGNESLRIDGNPVGRGEGRSSGSHRQGRGGQTDDVLQRSGEQGDDRPPRAVLLADEPPAGRCLRGRESRRAARAHGDRDPIPGTWSPALGSTRRRGLWATSSTNRTCSGLSRCRTCSNSAVVQDGDAERRRPGLRSRV